MTAPPAPDLRLFPLFVCRVAGLPAGALDGLQAPAAAALARRVLAGEGALAAARERVSELLHEAIRSAAGGEGEGGASLRGAWISLRRDLYNGRPVAPERLAGLPEGARAEAGRLLAARAELEEERAAYRRELPLALAAARRHLRCLLADPDFQTGLLLSSRALQGAQERYLRSPVEGLRTRERQIERGLLRYLTRMAAKATPFATFCSVVPGEIAEAAEAAEGEGAKGGALALAGDPLAKRGHVRLNKAFCGILVPFLAKDPEVRRHFLAELNPTLHTEERDGEAGLRFLASVRGRETFQRLPDQPALALLRGLLAERPRPLGELVAALARHPDIEEEEGVVAPYVDRLVEIGFLRLTAGIPAQELDWDLALRDRLAPCGAERARKASALLATLREQAAAYAASPRAERAPWLDRMEASYEEFRAGEELAMRVKVPVYEDATAAASARLDPGALAGVEADVAAYVELAGRMSLQWRDLANMRRYYERRYGAETGAVPLLRFYEDYYRDHYKEHLEREARARRGEAAEGDAGYDLGNPFGLEPVARLLEARRAFATRIADRWSAGVEEIDLAASDLAELTAPLPPLPARPGFSVTFYADWVPPGDGRDEPRLVVRQGMVTPGFGKMFSRFLYLFPDEFTAALRRRNGELTGDLLAELCEDAYFNANLHPPLLGREIRYPLSESRGEGAPLLPADLAVVRARSDAHGLELIHLPSGRVVLPIDTGFLTPDARPPLYRLLMAFMPGPSVALPLPEGRAGEAEVMVRPRITFNRRLVFQRKAWLVPGRAYPRPESGEGEADYGLRLARWRAAHGIPEEVYVRFQKLAPRPDPGGAAAPEGDRAKPRPAPPPRPAELDLEAQKPQFVDFASPLLADFFGHLPPPGEDFIALLEERLPGRGALARAGGREVVTELVLQMDRAEPAGTATPENGAAGGKRSRPDAGPVP